MKKPDSKRTFFDLFNHNSAFVKVKFDTNSNEEPILIQIENTLERKVDSKRLNDLIEICSDPRLQEFVEFYSSYNGFNLGTAVKPRNAIKKALLKQVPVSELRSFTKKYSPGGEWGWTIDLNKSRSIYRTEEKWLAFASVDNEPACLTIFLTGDYAGSIFLLNPQPRFNILKPIAKSYNALLERIAKDPAAFFKLIRAYVTLVHDNNQHYGYVPIEYCDQL